MKQPWLTLLPAAFSMAWMASSQALWMADRFLLALWMADTFQNIARFAVSSNSSADKTCLFVFWSCTLWQILF
jgi:hypothetical protein